MAYYKCEKWTLPDNYAGASWEGYYTSGFGRSRDSDTIEESNFHTALVELNKLNTDFEGLPTVETVRESHWAVGWVEWIAIHSSNTAAIALATELCDKCEDYPILDEDHHSQLELDLADDIWRRCYNTAERVDYIRAHRDEFEFTNFADMLGCVRGNYFVGYAGLTLGRKGPFKGSPVATTTLERNHTMARERQFCCVDLTRHHITYKTSTGSIMIGTVEREYYGNGVGLQVFLKVRFFNGEQWPFDPPKWLVEVI